MYKLLIVEDDAVIRNSLAISLKKWGYIISSCEDFNDITSQVINEKPHLILLDISLPFYNGFYWCNAIRKHTTTPIIFISSASDNMSIVTAMNSGGDDFVAKPFDFNVLLAKITAVLRRTYDFNNDSSCIEYDGIILNLSKDELEYNGNNIQLTRSETKIIETLILCGGKIVSKEDLMQKLWQNDDFIDDNILAVNITRLRKKLNTLQLKERLVCKKNQGYSLI